jgi:hypothetical protein
MEYKQNEKHALTEKSTEGIIGDEDQVSEAAGGTASTDVSSTTCIKCKISPIATATAEIVADVTQTASIISTGDASSTASVSKSGAVAEVHRTWFAAIISFFALGWILCT